MPILIATITLLAAIATWYFRVKRIGMAAREVREMTRRAANAPRKFAFMRRAKMVGLKAVKDPREAAAILLVLVGGARADAALHDSTEKVILQELGSVMKLSESHAEDLLAHAVWMVREVDVASGVVRAMSQIIVKAPEIAAKELVDLDSMLVAVTEASGQVHDEPLRLLQVYRDQAGLRA